jgi:ABC-type amino acid transport substrate-binding protein
MKKNSINFIFLFLSVLAIMIVPVFIISAQTKDLLTPEETLWLNSRNNTIVVYPEKSFAPFSYQSNSGTPLGLSVDYIEIIAEKVGAKIEYLPAKSLSQILEDVKLGKGDVITSLVDSPEKQDFIYFTDSYIDISSVIVVRKDSSIKNGITLNDLNGQKVAITSSRAVENFVSKNYPRIIISPVKDDEIGLQQVVLGEVDAAIMDIASLSFYLSKQVLSSVKVVGNTGFEYKLSFGVSKEKQILQSILDKGLTQISKNERSVLNEKWVVAPEEYKNDFWAIVRATLTNDIFQYNFFLFTIFILFIIFMKHKETYKSHYKRLLKKKEDVEEVEEEVDKLEKMSDMLKEELDNIKETENKLKEKLESIDK